MKKILVMLLTFLILLGTCGCGKTDKKAVVKGKSYIESGTAKNDVTANEYKVVAENDNIVLRVNSDTTDMEVIVKQTGAVWRSIGAIDNDGHGNSISFTYLNHSGAVTTMNAFDDSVKKGQYSIDEIDSGIRITYSFGDIANNLIYPTYISAERFEKFTSKMSEYQKSIAQSLYRHISPDLYSEDMYAEFIKGCPAAKGKDVYLLRNADMLLNTKKQLAEVFAAADYTEDELERDNKEFKVNSSVSSSQSTQFNLVVEYKLDGTDLIVSIPQDSMYWSDNLSGIESLSIMQFFGSPNKDADGYFLLPDGSGAVMNFYNGTENAGRAVTLPVYGENLSVTKNESIYKDENTVLPIWGIKNNDSAMIAVIEKGDAIANINAVSGTESMSARAWPSFNILDTQEVYPKSLSDTGYYTKASYTKEQAGAYNGPISVRYHFLSGDSANYSGMATWYSNYLFGERLLQRHETPLYVETVSGIDYQKNVAGFSSKFISTITSFSETQRISEDLNGNNVGNQKIILSGWQKNGWRSGYVTADKISKAAGGADEFNKLAKYCEDNNIGFYPETDVQLVYSSAIKGSVKKSMVSRNLVQQLASKYNYSLSDYQKKNINAYVMTPDYTASAINSAVNFIKKNGGAGISLRYLSKYMIPDYKSSNLTNREVSKDLLTSLLEEVIKKEKINTLSRVGNVPYATLLNDVVELPLYSNRQNNYAYEVPFTAMVYSGRIDFSGSAVNLNGTDKKSLLKSVESGAGLYCIVSYRKDEMIKNSDFSEWFSICYDDIKDDILGAYRYVSDAQKSSYGQRITLHERLTDNVYKTSFADGSWIIVNYNEYEFNANGVSVEPCGYIRGES